jgi:hypothetical protein
MMASSATSQKWEKKHCLWPPWTLKKPENGFWSINFYSKNKWCLADSFRKLFIVWFFLINNQNQMLFNFMIQKNLKQCFFDLKFSSPWARVSSPLDGGLFVPFSLQWILLFEGYINTHALFTSQFCQEFTKGSRITMFDPGLYNHFYFPSCVSMLLLKPGCLNLSWIF